jgi:very-short-patch-repair endonuclease
MSELNSTEIKNKDHSLLAALLKKARQSLIETGTRNRLINFPKGNSKIKALEIVDELSDQIFDILLRSGKKMSFLPGRAGSSNSENVQDDLGIYLPPPDDAESDGPAARHTDTKLQTKLTPEGLQKRLLSLYRDAKSLLDEQGVDILFLAIGFLEWYEAPNSETPRYAPLILLPVELVRDDSRSSFKVQIREEDLSHNIALEERLRQDFGITVPPIPDDEDWTPSVYCESVREAIASQKRWVVDDNMMALGFFSFTKIAMFRDLDPANWPDGKLLEHPIIRSLLADGFQQEEKLFPDEASMDEVLHPSNMVHVVDADSSQALVIEAIRQGRNMVVQGPPGTGKSQTITNIIATAVKEGKKVLFVAEKLAALNVVYSRLKTAGLSAICLELHSRGANKRSVLEEIGKTLASSTSTLSGNDIVEKLTRTRDKLNQFAAILNTPFGNTAVTPFEALGMQVYLTQSGIQPPKMVLPHASRWTPSQFESAQKACQQYANVMRTAGLAKDHPWRGVGNLTLQPTDLQRLFPKLSAASSSYQTLQKSAAELMSLLNWEGEPRFGDIETMCNGVRILAERPTSIPGVIDVMLNCSDRHRLSKCIETAEKFEADASEINAWFNDLAWKVDLAALSNTLSAKGHSFVGRLSGDYRKARDTFRSISNTPIPEDVSEQVRRVDRLTAAIAAYNRMGNDEQFVSENLGALWQTQPVDYALAKKILRWLDRIQAEVSWIPPLVTSNAELKISSLKETATNVEHQLMDGRRQLHDITTQLQADPVQCFGYSDYLRQSLPSPIIVKLEEWLSQTDRYNEWARICSARKTLNELDLASIAEDIESGIIAINGVEADMAFCRAEEIWKAALRVQPLLSQLEGEVRQELVEEFRLLENQRQKFAQREVLATHSAKMPRGSVGQMGTLRGEIARKRGHLPVRKLVGRAGQVLQQIKPVMLMSPLSVAQFLPPGTAEFDLLVIDEASQVKPEDSLGAIARCKQIAVVGDKKQLPPTSFFDRMVDDDGDENEDEEMVAVTNVGDMESVLTLCEARGVPSRMLRWHYRSRHPSLIEVSNSEFYEDNMFLPPSPQYDRGQNGFIVRKVAGAYDRGGKRNNRIEAEEVIRAIKLHARNTPERSLGIVTFSMTQKQLIDDLLEVERRKDQALERFAARLGTDEIFVKNIETVQGDERDVIFVSVGYGPRQAGLGLDSMSFGPVSSEGGERRLNVLFTRARFRCEVFVSFLSGDIDLSRTTQRGPQVLKRFLKYGETGSADLPYANGGFDSPFEQSVADAIHAMGFEVDSQVGSVGFRIDLAVKNPEQLGSYIIAVECDGASYHSSKSARERDRLRQSVLEGLGWRFYRIWSTDWFKCTDREKEKLRAVIKKSIESASLNREAPKVETDESPAPTNSSLNNEKTSEVSPSAASSNPPYEEADFAVNYTAEPHELTPREMAEIVTQIVAIEGPVHEEEIARRVARLFGKDRTGIRISDSVLRGLRIALKTGSVSKDGSFWTHSNAVETTKVRSRSEASSSLRKANMISPMEIKEAIRQAVMDNGELTSDEAVSAVTKAFGFERTGPDLRAAIAEQFEETVKQ